MRNGTARLTFYFFLHNLDDNVLLTKPTAQSQGGDGTKTTLHVSTPKNKQGTVPVIVNLCFAVLNKPLSL